jgi:hypothetical protein
MYVQEDLTPTPEPSGAPVSGSELPVSLAQFATDHSLPFEHKLVPAKRGVIIHGIGTKDRCFAAVFGLTIDAQGLYQWTEEKALDLPQRTLKPLQDAGCRFDPAGYFSKKMRTVVIEFDPRSPEQSQAVIRWLGVPKKRTANAGLLAYNAARRAITEPQNRACN